MLKLLDLPLFLSDNGLELLDVRGRPPELRLLTLRRPAERRWWSAQELLAHFRATLNAHYEKAVKPRLAGIGRELTPSRRTALLGAMVSPEALAAASGSENARRLLHQWLIHDLDLLKLQSKAPPAKIIATELPSPGKAAAIDEELHAALLAVVTRCLDRARQAFSTPADGRAWHIEQLTSVAHAYLSERLLHQRLISEEQELHVAILSASETDPATPPETGLFLRYDLPLGTSWRLIVQFPGDPARVRRWASLRAKVFRRRFVFDVPVLAEAQSALTQFLASDPDARTWLPPFEGVDAEGMRNWLEGRPAQQWIAVLGACWPELSSNEAATQVVKGQVRTLLSPGMGKQCPRLVLRLLDGTGLLEGDSNQHQEACKTGFLHAVQSRDPAEALAWLEWFKPADAKWATDLVGACCTNPPATGWPGDWLAVLEAGLAAADARSRERARAACRDRVLDWLKRHPGVPVNVPAIVRALAPKVEAPLRHADEQFPGLERDHRFQSALLAAMRGEMAPLEAVWDELTDPTRGVVGKPATDAQVGALATLTETLESLHGPTTAAPTTAAPTTAAPTTGASAPAKVLSAKPLVPRTVSTPVS